MRFWRGGCVDFPQDYDGDETKLAMVAADFFGTPAQWRAAYAKIEAAATSADPVGYKLFKFRVWQESVAN